MGGIAWADWRVGVGVKGAGRFSNSGTKTFLGGLRRIFQSFSQYVFNKMKNSKITLLKHLQKFIKVRHVKDIKVCIF